jgi:subtilisin family serine protease
MRGRRAPLESNKSLQDKPRTQEGTAFSFYGEAEEQISQINLIALHDLGYTGAGVRIGVLDTGFRRSHEAFNHPSHPLVVITEWDFVNDDPDTAPEMGDAWNQHEHGTVILGAIAAVQPEVLIGSAPDASYILAKVDDVVSEYPLEEDWFAAGLEFIEQNGGDLATSSLTIYDYYTQEQMDGKTSVMAQAVNTATDNGLHVCQGAGNAGHDDDPATSSLVTPTDAFKAISVGSVDYTDTIASFSSDGPTADGRQKPEVLARGVNTRTVSPWLDTGTTGYDGASMATPLVCGASVCLLQAHPEWTIDQLRTHLFLHGDYYLAMGEPDPLYVHGFGIIDAVSSFEEDCNNNGVEDPFDLDNGTSGDCNNNSIPDECDVEALNSADDAVDGLPDECTECLAGPGCPAEVLNLQLSKQFPDVVLTWDAAVNATEYTVRRDETAPAAGTTEVARVPQLNWMDENAITDPPDTAFYLICGVTAGGIAGPCHGEGSGGFSSP